MSFKRIEEFEKRRTAEKAAAAESKREAAARLELKRAVKDVLPKALTAPKRKRGRTPDGGLSRKEVAAIRAKAAQYLEGAAGLQALEGAVQHTALVILLIDGVLGTEPWRASAGPHGGIVAANARMRYLENAARLLEDIRRSRSGSEPKLLEGVIDAEEMEPTPAALPSGPEDDLADD